MGSFLLAQLRLPARGVEWMRAVPKRDAKRALPERKKTPPKQRPASKPAEAKRLVRGQLKHTRHPLVIATPKATRAYRRTFRILMNRPQVTDRYDEIILKYAELHDLDPRLLKSIMSAESEFNHKARSPAGARGLMQLMPRTA
ncbi:transglycosylase SLT domain-containing protein, partial [Elusimicrobiota bacterium]